MIYKRQGLPDIDEVVLCKVTKIFPNSVFVDFLEYNDSGMVHISEISPGRIRNLRDYVTVGRQIVCKVLRIDRERGHIDLSLRRVNSNQKREKLDEVKQEQKAENLVSNVAKRLDIPFKDLYNQVTEKIFQEYSYLHQCFKDIVDNAVSLEKLGLDKKVSQEIEESVLDKFKPVKITISGTINLETYIPEGVEKIRTILLEIGKISKTINVNYLGAGAYKLIIEDLDYKPAEKNLKKIQELLEKFEDKLSKASFKRE
ncbi:S1 RNA-binding domain-containing protein [Candidatus Woesearchaeota archaeon]|jgi:translation initiation factor 2 subunit 1|nr:S1 RNA-binding domain-containing protein [Candidatus Woesearchaeota archaeon]